MIEEKVTWTIFKKNTGFNCITTTVNNNFIKHLKLTNNPLPTLEIMKERRYDLYEDVKLANNTINKCEQMLKDFLSKKEYIQLNQEDTQQLYSWNRNFFIHITEMFITEFYKVIWQPCCDIVADWEHIKGIKKQNLRKKISAQQRIVYKRIPIQQVEDDGNRIIWKLLWEDIGEFHKVMVGHESNLMDGGPV
ncbi:hypothetical protein C1646_775397 [Rhizophagus diaphanus]|nr:hypothetical protein C1646_775397 [Rhizophagus diaphanus] [Rhizophagus sp. MUCL 43196]